MTEQNGSEAFFGTLRELMPEDQHADIDLAELTQKLDNETEFLGDGFEKLETYQKIVDQFAEKAIPALIAELKVGYGHPWWRIQMVGDIVAKSELNQPMRPMLQKNTGKYNKRRDATVRWGIEHGYIEGRATDKIQIIGRKILGIA